MRLRQLLKLVAAEGCVASSSYAGSSPSAASYASARKGTIGMAAATTSLVRSVWQDYFSPEHQQQLQPQAGPQLHQQQQLEAVGAAAGGALPQQEVAQVAWLDAVSSTDSDGRQLHHTAQLRGGSTVSTGQAVRFSGQQLPAAAAAAGGLPQGLVRALAEKQLTGLLQCMWETAAGRMMAQVRAAGAHGVLGDGVDDRDVEAAGFRARMRVQAYWCGGRDEAAAVHAGNASSRAGDGSAPLLDDSAAEAELFVTNCYVDVPLQGLASGATASPVFRLQRPFEAGLRLQQRHEDGRPGRCFYRHLYLPDQAMFAALPGDLGFGVYAEPPEQAVQLALLPDAAGFIKEGVQYRGVGDLLYLNNGVASCRAATTKGSLQGLKAWQVARLMEVSSGSSSGSSSSRGSSSSSSNASSSSSSGNASSSSSSSSSSPFKQPQAGLPSFKLRVQPLFRPEDISEQLAYTAGLWDLYAPAAAGAKAAVDAAAADVWVDASRVAGKCTAVAEARHVLQGVDASVG
ncbi:hypothetical protein COO60DRAFT_1638438 [Scenedesmus sp. NREL 46B-D3]|nr:hypothetical protein COO60DRAFT_1638438 [Scenedesmus sp. NREL 46B-D3]